MKVKAEKNICAENSGSNSGTIVGVNNGVINYSLPQQPTPSLLYPVIKAMAEIDDKKLNNSINARCPFKPEDKLNHNEVIKYRELFTIMLCIIQCVQKLSTKLMM